MRILYFATHKLWPLNSGNRLRDFYLAQELAKRAAVTFVELCRPGEEPSVLPRGGGFQEIVSLRRSSDYTVWKTIRGVTGPTPLTVLNYFEPRLARELERVLAQKPFDTVQVEGVHLSQYRHSIHSAPGSPPVLIDWQNIESELMRRYSENTRALPKKIAAKRTADLLVRSENLLLEGEKAHTVPSERERQELLARCPSARVIVVPNGVDTNFFSTLEIARHEKNSLSASGKPTILFVGSMDYHANVDGVTWFARDIWPAVSKKRPDVEFVIVGRSPAKEVLALASDKIRVTGTVEDVRPFYTSAVAAVVPLRVGAGTRLKILEAMAAGIPVVSTSLGAEGIDAVPDTHFLLADTSAAMAEAIAQLSDLSTRDRIAQAARDFVVSRYDWSIIGEKLYKAHLQLTQR